MDPFKHEPEVVTATVPTQRGRWARLLDPGEPHPYRGPFTRWPLAADVVLAVAVFVASLVAVTANALSDGVDLTIASIGDQPAAALGLLALAAGAIGWRRAHPIAVTAFVLAVMVCWALIGYGEGQDLALVVAIYSVGRYTTDYSHSLVTVIAVIVVSTIAAIIDTQQHVDLVAAVVFLALPWYVGRRVRNRGDYLNLLRERAQRREAEHQARARQAVADERSRIARELHDVVAHRVSMMTVQAGAAKTIARDDLDTAVAAMGDIERAGRQALGELRHLLGVLRADTADPDELGPQPGVADIPALVDNLAHTGAAVTLTIAELPDPLPAAVDLSAYRIVQESLTNVIKHAGPNPTVTITVVHDDDDGLAIDITNTTSSARSALPGSGYGLAGMQERASLLGGTITASLQPPNRYHVCARLPLGSGLT